MLETLEPKRTFWYIYYLRSPQVGDKTFDTKFCNRFRLSYESFIDLFNHIKEYPLFKKWNNKQVDTPIILVLLLLGSLWYLGRGWTMDDLKEATAILREIIEYSFSPF